MKQIVPVNLLISFSVSPINNRYGKVFKTNILGTPIIVSTDTEVNKVVLLNQGNIFIPAYPKSVRELFGKSSILHTNGSPHKRMHALILGFLRSAPLKARVTKVFENSVKLALATWKDNNPIYVQNESKKVSIYIILSTLSPKHIYYITLKTQFSLYLI